MKDDVAARYLTLHELVRAARAKLGAEAWAYIVGGTETEATVRRNRHAIESVALRPRVLNDATVVSPRSPTLPP